MIDIYCKNIKYYDLPTIALYRYKNRHINIFKEDSEGLTINIKDKLIIIKYFIYLCR